MLFQFQGKPQRLVRLLKLFKGMSEGLREWRSRYARTVAAASLVYLVACVAALSQAGEAAVEIFWFLGGCGMLSLLWGWAFLGSLQRYPRKRRSTATGIMFAIGLLALAGIGIANLYDDGLAWLGETVAAVARPTVWAMWGLASLGVFLASRWIVWLRLRDERVQDDELDFLHKLLMPLLRDLPPDAACAFSCNPFTPMWSEKHSTESVGMRKLYIYDDVLLDFKAKLDEDTTLALQTLHRRVDKYKSTAKKTKFKGTKHRVAMVCRFQHPALARLGEAESRQLGQVCESLQGQRRKYAVAVRRDLRAGKITVVGKGRFSNAGELGAADLPDTEGVLAAVRALSAFTARQSDKLPAREVIA